MPELLPPNCKLKAKSTKSSFLFHVVLIRLELVAPLQSTLSHRAPEPHRVWVNARERELENWLQSSPADDVIPSPFALIARLTCSACYFQLALVACRLHWIFPLTIIFFFNSHFLLNHHIIGKIMQCKKRRERRQDDWRESRYTPNIVDCRLCLEPFQSLSLSLIDKQQASATTNATSRWRRRHPNDNIQSDTCKNAVGFSAKTFLMLRMTESRRARERAIYLSSNCHSHKMINSLLGRISQSRFSSSLL